MENWRIKLSLFMNYFVFAILLNSVGTVILQVQNNFGITESSASILEAFKDLSIAITSFLYGLTGLTVAIVMMNFIMIKDWPQDIGGKPSFSYIANMPAFVPVMFEMTVFFGPPHGDYLLPAQPAVAL